MGQQLGQCVPESIYDRYELDCLPTHEHIFCSHRAIYLFHFTVRLMVRGSSPWGSADPIGSDNCGAVDKSPTVSLSFPSLSQSSHHPRLRGLSRPSIDSPIRSIPSQRKCLARKRRHVFPVVRGNSNAIDGSHVRTALAARSSARNSYFCQPIGGTG
jgi:hypothetical protein